MRLAISPSRDLAISPGHLAGRDLATPGRDLATPGRDLATPGRDLAIC